jgi:hypothetical protein
MKSLKNLESNEFFIYIEQPKRDLYQDEFEKMKELIDNLREEISVRIQFLMFSLKMK